MGLGTATIAGGPLNITNVPKEHSTLYKPSVCVCVCVLCVTVNNKYRYWPSAKRDIHYPCERLRCTDNTSACKHVTT
jgi:hypothetical protein